MTLTARSLELFFIDGRPDGMLTAEVFNWTGHVLRIPRTQFKDGLARPEAQFTGVYVLLGERDGAPLAYVGEAEDMRDRLRNHVAGKDWWDTAILITTSANNLHKAHVRYLEARLITIARDVNAMPLENGNQPSGSSLSEADRANMESFLDTLMMVLPAIRVDNFLSKKRVATTIVSQVESKHQEFEFTIPRHGIAALANIRDGEVIVQKGSTIKATWSGPQDYLAFREHSHLRDAGLMIINAGLAILNEDYAFSSLSTAASIVAGRQANGSISWKVVGTNQTYADWENAQLAEVTP